ncbi:Annexin [Marasmius fiardii PR-910]|nr:Annexin [Marasmius fiardii PR-910]
MASTPTGYAPGYAPPPGPPPQFNAPPPQHFSYQPPPNAGIPNQPTSFYLNVQVPTPAGPQQPPPPAPGYDPTGDYERIRKATKGFGTDESALIKTLAPLDAMKLANLAFVFKSKSGKRLVDVLAKETSGWFKAALWGVALGPLWYDVDLVNDSIQDVGTNETLLTEIIADRTPSDLNLLSIAYRQRYGKSLENEVRDDLSAKTKRMFTMILANNRPPDNMPVDHSQVERDVTTLYKAGEGKLGTDEIAFCEVIVNRSRPHLTALCKAYGQKYRSLTKAIKSEFSGHMRFALLYIVNGAKEKHIGEGPGVWRDAKLLEASMKGLGTKDKQLVWRIVRFHWDKPRFEAIKKAYHKKYKKSLESRVSGETSGDYKKMMLALISA